MKLTIIDYQEVEWNNLQPPHPANFNSSFQTEDEAPDLARPSETPCHFKRWLPLILRTRNLPSTAAQTIALSRSQATLLLEATNGSIQRGAINMMYTEDIEDEITPALAGLSFPPDGLFMRFEACSPKDGAQKVRGRRSLHTVDEIILRLVTSYRARNALSDVLQSGASRVEFVLCPVQSADAFR